MADALRRNNIRLFATVPDYIVSQVLEPLWADEDCTVITSSREEEGLGMLSGAYLGGQRGALLMQNSGLGNCVNTLASLNIAAQIPVVMVLSHRGDLGEFNPAQVPMGQACEQILQALECASSCRRRSKSSTDSRRANQAAYTRSLPVAPSSAPELTGGKAG